MKPEFRKRALQAHRLTLKNITGKELAARMKLADAPAAHHLSNIGGMIAGAEACDLTENEWLVMKTLARVEARRIERGDCTPKSKHVDWAARKYTGWCAKVAEKRLRERRNDDEFDSRHLGFLRHSLNGHIWLTAKGWSFVWGARLIRANWRVPR